MDDDTSTDTDTSTDEMPRKILTDDELWNEITRHAEERSGEYVTQDDLEL